MPEESVSGDSILTEDFLHRLVRVLDQAQEQMLDGNILVAHLLCLVLGMISTLFSS